jgi:hypothetical protein
MGLALLARQLFACKHSLAAIWISGQMRKIHTTELPSIVLRVPKRPRRMLSTAAE